MSDSSFQYNYQNIQVVLGCQGQPFEGIPLNESTAVVLLNRPKQLNAINSAILDELQDCFTKISHDNRVNAVVFAANGRAFSAGIDVKDGGLNPSLFDGDGGRVGYKLYHFIRKWQDQVSSIEQCSKPVVAAVHGICYGFGVDLITACDIRYCSKDMKLSVKEVDIGMAADMGTLQRLPKVVGNQSWVREICFTARDVKSEEASHFGLVSRVFEDQKQLIAGAIEFANQLAEKSPIGITSTKHSLVFSLDHPIKDGLEHIATRNMSSLNSEDFITAVSSALTKTKPKFAKL